ncbi:hypothetical protein GPX89_01770 [Nocardia sp. ET3-3]|uniref:Beta-lactamase class A catalytic domain-containing protein n=1 Tax=Nocardia terrae TaxID=2675851 RepID=A0A7K1UPZ3_9NOCA|nr:serine hydrolase [Nocardia terrae]MVU75968.1 hypothetical protein [Nocardia terrae]
MSEETVSESVEVTAAAALEWVVGAAARAPLPEDEIGGHVAPMLIEVVGGTEGFNAVLAQLGRPEVTEIRRERPDAIWAMISGRAEGLLMVHVNEAGLIDTARLVPAAADIPVPTSWGEIDSRLEELGCRVAFAAMRIEDDGQPRLVHGVDADTARPTGSGFKLYVLAALARAVAAGRADWQELLPIREEWKSFPSGTLQNRPAGEKLSLATYAEYMMAISDNTATDHLIHHLGRPEVFSELTELGHPDPDLNLPFLTTRAFFQCKVPDDGAHAQRFLEATRGERIALVEELERLDLPDPASSWVKESKPRHIDEIEWFATPSDLCRAYAGLLRFAQPEIDHILTRDDHGLGLDSTRFPTVWSKPGSEVGVITLNYLARTADHRTFAASLMLSDPTAGFDEMLIVPRASRILQGAFDLLAATG